MKFRLLLFLLAAVLMVSGCASQPGPVQDNVKGPEFMPDQGPQVPPGPGGGMPVQGEVSVQSTGSSYRVVTQKPAGWFTSGQEADMLLSGVDFNNAGGPLFFNHQGGIASDGNHLILADRNNNRVLIWNSLPAGNTPPDIVLGQKDFTGNNPGEGLDQLNWPVAVATDGKHLLVADTYNDRVLVWDSFPAQNGQAADFALTGAIRYLPDSPGTVGWPWAVWTDGEKLIVASTAGSQVLIWNSFPAENRAPDIVLKLDDFGTPRTIGSDGTNLVVGDHNAFNQNQGNFFWKSFPTNDDQMYDFFMRNARGEDQQSTMGEIFWGPTFTEDGRLVAVGESLYIWNQFPENGNDVPDLSVGRGHNVEGYDFGGSQSGDGSGIVIAGEKLYVSLCNGNKIVGFNSMPRSPGEIPDFAVGSPDIYTNTLETNFIISNPVPATDGKSLFVSSDFDRKLYVWKSLPDESGAEPDFVYSLPDAPWDNALFNGKLALAGRETVFLWDSLPLNGEKPDKTFSRNIGSVTFKNLGGVAMDSRYLYLADSDANRIYVWEGIPEEDSEPVFTISSERPFRLSSDGQYLAVANTLGRPGGSVEIYRIGELPDPQQIVLNGMFNLPQGTLVYNGRLFVGDTGFNTVHIWNDIEDAISGKEADIFFGEKGYTPEIGRNKLFWPAVLAFDGSYLWIGEFKFSERLLRFPVQ